MNSFQCLKDPSPIYSLFEIVQYLISKIPFIDAEKEPFPSVTVFRWIRLAIFNSFIHSKERLPALNECSFFNSICNMTMNRILFSFNSQTSSGLPRKDSSPISISSKLAKSIHYSENGARPSKTVLLQDEKHLLPTFTFVSLLHLEISKAPFSVSEKQPPSISTCSSVSSPRRIKSLTFFKEPFLICTSFRLRNLVKSRVTKSSSLQLWGQNVNFSTLCCSPSNSALFLTATREGNAEINTANNCYLMHTISLSIYRIHASLFLFQAQYDELLSSIEKWQLLPFYYSYWMHEHNCRTPFPDSMILRSIA